MALVQSTKTFFAIGALLILIANPILTTSQTSYAASTTGIMIPLYTYPGGTWDTVIQTKNAHPSVPIVAIINPNNGPGGSRDSNYVSGIQELQSAGVVVIGYVFTQYGSRSTSSVTADIDTWKTLYPQLQGIFFDEMTNTSGDENYYRNLSNYAKSVGLSFTVGNPGTDIAPSYIGTMDNIFIYETGGLPSLNQLGGWHTSYDKSNFSYLAYGVPTLNEAFVDSSANYVSYMYITNDSLPNPWDSVTPYFMNLAATLDDGTTTPPPPNPSSITLTVQSVDLGGDSITGMWTEISSGSILVSTGYTTLSYIGSENTEYQVCVADYQKTIFDHWEDGSTNSCRTITAQQDTTLTASYKTDVNIEVKSVNLAGSPITGMWTEIYSGTTIVKTGYTPLTYTATYNTEYRVCASNYQKTIFDHWEDGSTNSCRTITAQQDTTLTANYKASVTIKVRSLGLDGSQISGLWTEISSGNKLVKTGYTTLSYTASSGTTYQVCMANYQNYVFDHWADGSTNNCKIIAPTTSVTLTGYYLR